MAKLALLFVAAFCLVQLSQCATVEAREKRDAGEATDAGEAIETSTQGLLDIVKTGFEKAFSKDNLKKVQENLEELGGKLKEIGEKTYDNLSNALKKNDGETATEKAE